MIHIEDNWYIDADEYSFILMRDTGSKDIRTGGVVFRDHKYYKTMQKAVEGYIQYRLKKITSENNLELSEALRAFSNEVKRLTDMLDVERMMVELRQTAQGATDCISEEAQ